MIVLILYSVDGLDPRQNIGFEKKGNIGDIGILGVKYRRYCDPHFSVKTPKNIKNLVNDMYIQTLFRR